MMAEYLKAMNLAALPNVAHGFFTRRGGVSRGIYASLNTGLGSRDSRANALKNRARAARALGAPPQALCTPRQVHSAICAVAERPWPTDSPPTADAVATATPGVLIGVGTADCTPVLLVDPRAGVVAAAHAGWKGALGGVLEATIETMETLGACRGRILAAIGPVISAENYEVGPEFRHRFLSRDLSAARFFHPAPVAGKWLFDLPAYVRARLKAAGLVRVETLGRCTYAEEELFFSFRRATHRREPDYGRQLSAIMLRP
jgi:hypothetical protein